MLIAARFPTRPAAVAGARTRSSSATCSSTGTAGSIIVSGFFEPVFYLLGHRLRPGHARRGRRRHPVRGLRGARPHGDAAMNGALYGVDLQPLLQAALRQDVRRHPGHAAGSAGRRGRARWPGRSSAACSTPSASSSSCCCSASSSRRGRSWPSRARCSSASPRPSVGMAATTFMRKWQDFDLVLGRHDCRCSCSARTFFPITVYPDWLRILVELTPLYRGVHMLRSLTTGTSTPTILIDVAYLGTMGVDRAWPSRRGGCASCC